jgi:uncharacterized protein YbjT (DUF2867 family)
MSTHILVLGAGGNVGRPLVQTLVSKGLKVKAATRSGQPVAGAPGVRFDYQDPSTWATAMDGVDSAYVVLPGGHVQVQALLLPVIAALAERRIKTVFQSVLGVDADDNIPYRQVELTLERSGTPWVTLRPNWFADNFHTFWKAGIDQGTIALPAGAGASSFIDARDIADSAAAALTTHVFDGQAYNLTGPAALGYAEAAALIGPVVGHPVVYQAITDAAFVAQLVGAGVPADYAQFLASIFHPVREGWTAVVSGGVQQLTGHAPRSLATYLQDHAGALRG